MADAPWSLFVQYPNREPVCREVAPPRSLGEVRDALEIFDDQQLMVVDDSSNGRFVRVQHAEQIYDGASLRVTVPQRRIFVSLGDSVHDRAVVWYPGATADQIESAIVKACGLPLGTPIELIDGDDSVVISATIPNDSSLIVLPLNGTSSACGNISVDGRDSRNGLHVPSAAAATVAPPRAAARPRSPERGASASGWRGGGGSVQGPSRTPPAGMGGRSPSARSVNSLRGASAQRSQSATTGARARDRVASRGTSPTREMAPSETVAQPPGGRSSAPDEHCVHILAGHGGFVLCLATVGDVLFTGSQDANIMIWDLNNLQYIGTLPGHRGFVKCLCASYSRKLLCSGSQDKTIKVWSLDTFSAIKTLFGHTGEVNTLTILDGTDVLISGAEDRSIRIWDLASLALLMPVEQAHLSGIFSVTQLDDSLFLSASRDRTVRVWTASTWQSRRTLAPPHYDGVTALAVGNKAGQFFSASRDRSIRRWDGRSFESNLQLTSAHGDWITSLALSPGEGVLFSGGKDCIVKVWDTELQCRDLLQGHRGAISALMTVNDHLFSASHDRTVRVWRIDQFEP